MLNILNLKRCSPYFFNLIKYSCSCSWKWSLVEMKEDFPSERGPSSTVKWKMSTKFKQKRIARYHCRQNVKHLIFVSLGTSNFRIGLQLSRCWSWPLRLTERGQVPRPCLGTRPPCAPALPYPLSNVSSRAVGTAVSSEGWRAGGRAVSTTSTVTNSSPSKTWFLNLEGN